MDIFAREAEQARKLDALITEVADILTFGSAAAELDRHYEANELQPTTTAVRLAAYAAVAVLLAHEQGQRTGAESERLSIGTEED